MPLYINFQKQKIEKIDFFILIYKDKRILMRETKNLKIDKDLHQKLKVFCVINNLKIIDFVEKILNEKISEEHEMDKRKM